MSLVMSFGGVDPSGQGRVGVKFFSDVIWRCRPFSPRKGWCEVSLVMSFGGVDPSVPARIGVKCL